MTVPHHIDGPARATFIAEAVNRLLGEGGQAAVTSRAITEVTGVGMSSLAHHFGGRRRMMSVSCHLSGLDFLRRLHARMSEHGVGGLVAGDDDERAFDRAWLAWTELARFDDHIGFQVVDIEDRESYLVGSTLGGECDADDLQSLVAAGRGLRAATCRSVEPMPYAEARRLLERLARRMAPTYS